MTTDNVKPASAPLQITTDQSRRLRVTRWLMRRLGELVLLKLVLKVTVTGLDNIPRSGPTIILFNHVTLLDPLVLAVAVPFRDMVPLGKEELSQNPLTGWMVWGWNTIPIRRGEVDRAALKRAIEVIESKDMLMIAPEGHRQKEGMRDPKEGIVMLATRTDATLIPVGLSGTQNFKHNLTHFRRTAIDIAIGAPVRLKEGISRKQYEQAAHEIMYRISPLIPPPLRGEYADVSKATMDTIEAVQPHSSVSINP